MAPRYGQPEEVESGATRVLCPNPSPMTEAGTNAYVLHDAGAALIVDPGPADPGHLDALRTAARGFDVAAVLVTHAHRDHSPGARPLADALGVPVLAFGPPEAGRTEAMRGWAARGLEGGEGVEVGFRPDHALADGASVPFGGTALRAIWTPGHMASHLSFAWPDRGLTLTGDTVMGWASTMISPPDGDVGQFLGSMERLAGLGRRIALPGHGAPVADLAARCHALRDHRLDREAALLAALRRPATIATLTAELYADTPPALHPAAARNVLAHLLHLHARERVSASPVLDTDARWHRVD